jgi:biotin carboxyl carrier protein
MASWQVLCEVAGKVIRIERGPGTRVAEGDSILLIECMKMEIPLVAPRAGRIAAIHVGEGEAVGEGQAAATLETG